MVQRNYTLSDRFCLGLDQALRTLFAYPVTTGRPNPAQDMENSLLSKSQAQHSAALMRINHAGEICAQALYHGQGLASKEQKIQENMQRAAIEEGDHLVWCQQRLNELNSHTSYLNPFWYTGSFLIGLTAGLVGDRWSLGFVAETEAQVVRHLNKHLHNLPSEDKKSRQILEQMQLDESKHHDEAVQAGAFSLPSPVKKLMALTSKVMVKTAYWL